MIVFCRPIAHSYPILNMGQADFTSVALVSSGDFKSRCAVSVYVQSFPLGFIKPISTRRMFLVPGATRGQAQLHQMHSHCLN